MFHTAADDTFRTSYSTTFTGVENPMTEGGNWIQGGTAGLDWNNMRKDTGFCYGTQSGVSGLYDDSVACLSGTWSNNHILQGTVRSTNPNTTAFCEVELWCRTQITAHSITGIETNFRCTPSGSAPYIGVVRWNGAIGDFTQYGSNVPGPGLVTGDVIRVAVFGTNHFVYHAPVADPTNFTLYVSTDLTSLSGFLPSSGAPGLGHWLRTNGAPVVASDYGLTTFGAVSL